MKHDIPKPTLGRLLKLAQLLEQIEQNAAGQTVSSLELEKLTGWTRDTIRRDISTLSAGCATVNGYDAKALKDAINKRIGLPQSTLKCCLVGLGRLGEALIDYQGLDGTPFTIAAGFDSNVNRTEILVAPFPLYTTVRMEAVIKAEGIEFAILTIPTKSAQAIAEKLVNYGIKGFVNFTPAVLTLPAEIKIENVSVLDALKKLAAKQTVLGSRK